MISGADDTLLLLWNISTYQCETIIKGVHCCSPNSLYQIDKDKVIIGGYQIINIVNIDKCIIEKTIRDTNFRCVNCFINLIDNNMILCGCEKGQFCFYYMNTKEYKINQNNHYSKILDFLMIDEYTFLSCSNNDTIKLGENN